MDKVMTANEIKAVKDMMDSKPIPDSGMIFMNGEYYTYGADKDPLRGPRWSDAEIKRLQGENKPALEFNKIPSNG